VPLPRNQAQLDLTVAWHANPIGYLRHDGFEWRWIPIDTEGPSLIRQTTPGKLPPFIVSLLPEGWLESVLKDTDERAMLRAGKRYMSNIAIVERDSDLADLPADLLLTRLADHTKDGVFAGRYAGPGRGDIEQSFERALARLYESADTPRLSGVQVKAPMYLDAKATLAPSTGKPFTHILKPAGTGGYEALPLVEWLDMALAKCAGFATPATALVAMPDEAPPALIVERFDIRESRNDLRMLALEDFCSVLELPTEDKYKGTMERVARAVRPLSTAPSDDLLVVVKRALFAWLVADGDMHLKNMALLKIAEPGDRTFRSVRMTPVYDAVTTRVFPRLKHDRLALKLNGKDDKLRRADFHALAATAGLRVADADDAIDGMLEKLSRAVDRMTLPRKLSYGGEIEKLVEELLDICRQRIKTFA
jgi:serine/threonine-protein kinase HipA